MHEGIDTVTVRPNPEVRLRVPGTDIELKAGDEVVTYVARNLEPYRGFPSFMKSLPALLRRRPNAHVLIVGGDETSYGPRLASGRTFRESLLKELGTEIDLSRVHFLGKLPYHTFLSVLQISSVHVYLTYPFVLSWSMLEAMAAQCLVVASNTAPVTEVIRDGENGLLVDLFDTERIAERMIGCLEDPGSYRALRVNARETIIEHYDLQTRCLPAQYKLLRDLAR